MNLFEHIEKICSEKITKEEIRAAIAAKKQHENKGELHDWIFFHRHMYRLQAVNEYRYLWRRKWLEDQSKT